MIGKLNKNEEMALKDFSKKLRALSGYSVKQVLLFGSKARGDFRKESDLDIFVLTDTVDSLLRKQTAKIVADILLEYGVLISPRLIPEFRYLILKRLETGFIKNVEKDGIKIE